ncbi:hypothetical protein MIR68_011599 [Amoeboaphelidium protococcarum]|nr:hypothetical protein MIR68_011599 [Amoeboaphelidium protococcarum]
MTMMQYSCLLLLCASYCSMMVSSSVVDVSRLGGDDSAMQKQSVKFYQKRDDGTDDQRLAYFDDGEYSSSEQYDDEDQIQVDVGDVRADRFDYQHLPVPYVEPLQEHDVIMSYEDVEYEYDGFNVVDEDSDDQMNGEDDVETDVGDYVASNKQVQLRKRSISAESWDQSQRDDGFNDQINQPQSMEQSLQIWQRKVTRDAHYIQVSQCKNMTSTYVLLLLSLMALLSTMTSLWILFIHTENRVLHVKSVKI